MDAEVLSFSLIIDTSDVNDLAREGLESDMIDLHRSREDLVINSC